MREKFTVAVGMIFLLSSGFIYTIEKNLVLLAGHIELLGFRIAKINGPVPEPKTELSNIFVWLFLLIGLGCILYSVIKSQKKK